MDNGRYNSTRSASMTPSSDSLDSTDVQASVVGYGPYSAQTLDVHDPGAGLSVPNAQSNQSYANPLEFNSVKFSRRKASIISLIITSIVIILVILSSTLFNRRQPDGPTTNASITVQDLKLNGEFINKTIPELVDSEGESLLVNGDLISRGFLKFSRNAFVATFDSDDLDDNQTYVLPNASGTICLDSNNCDFATAEDLEDFATTDQIEELRQLIPVGGDAAVASLSAGTANLVISDDGDGNLTISDTTANDSKVASFNGVSGSITVQGTPNQVSVTASGNTFTLSTPQDINTGASPTFSGLILSSLNCSGLANGGTLTTNGSGQLICANDDGGSGSSITGSGVVGALAKFDASQNLTSSIITESGTIITVGGSVTATSFSGNGSNLNALNAGNISTGTLNDARLSSNVTQQGNTFNGASQLVQLDGSSQLPAVSGALLTTLNASNIASGTLNDLRLSTNVSLLGQTIGLGELDADSVDSSKIADGSIQEVDLEITNAPTDNYVLSYDQATGGFTWVVDTGGTCPTCDNTADTIADDGVIALTTETSGDYVAGNTAGTGIAVTGTAGEGWSPTIGLDYAATLAANSLTANQSSFASTGLIFEGSTADGFETLLTLTNPTADNTITLPNASGTVAVSASGNIALSALGAITFTGTLPVGSGGTGATTLTSNGVLFGNGTGAIQATAAGTTGQCLIATTGSAPTWGTCTGAGGDSTPDTIADDGAISGSEISDNTIEEVDLEITNAPTDNYVLSYDQATGGFTWVVDTGGTCPTCDNTADTIADDGVIALTTETSGDYVAGNTAGTGIAVTGTAGEGWSPTIGLDYAATLAANSLTANQSSFASTGLIFEGSTADGFETLLTLTNPTADNTITLPNASGTVAVSASGNIALSALGAITFTGTLPVGSGGTGATTLTSNGVLFGNGTGAIQATAAGTTGQCLIATTGSAPTWGTCTGAGGDSTPDTIADDGAISGSEISDNTIEEVDLEITNAPTDNYVLSYDQATGGFTWVVDTGGTCPTCDNTADTIADDGVIALTTETSGDYVAGNTAGTGIAVTGTAGEGWSPTIGLDYAATLAANSLTANQSSFASTGLIFEGSTADGFETLLTLTNPTADNTITLPNASGTVAVSASGNIALSALGAITFTGTLPVGSGGTGATTLTSNGVLFGNGTGAIQATAAGTTGQCLIATTGSAPTWGTCTGAGGDSTPDTIADDGAISGSEISDNTIEEVDLEITNAPTDNYVLSYDQATGGFTWVVDTGGTCPTCDNTADTIADDGVIALTTETSGDYVAGNTAGTGIAVTGTAGEGWSPTIGLDYAATLAANSLTANQSSFASTGLIFEGSTADGFETLLTLTNPTADNTITLPNASGTVAVSASGNIALSALGAITFTGTLPVGSGGTGATTLTSNGVLFGNGTGAIQATAAGTTGQCLIATTGSAPTWGTCTGAGGDSTPDTIADDGAISGSEISDNTIEEVDLEITNAPTDNYVLSYDQATGGFTWVVDTGGTCPTCDNTADTIADDGVIALTTETSGDYVAGNTAGTGIAVTGTAGEGWSPTIGLDYAATLAANSLTANQSSFASTGLIFEGSTADGFETLLTLTNPTADNTITLPNASGTVAVSASGNIALSALGAITFTGTLPVGSGGTGATTLTSNGVLFGNGTGAIQATAAGTTGQCLIATTGSAPTWGTCTGAGGDSTPDTIADDGAISGSEISDNTIEEVDLEITNAPTDNYVLSYDQATGGFTWVVDTGGTCPTCDNTADTIADDGVIALTTETSGDYVAGNTAGTGIAVTGTAGEGWSPTIGLDYAATLAANSLTANQSSFASTGLIFEGSTADGFETLLTLTNPTADNTITLPNASGTVAVSASGNIALSALGAITFTGTLPVGSGGTGATTLTSNGVLFGNGTGAIQATAAGTTGQCLIATTGSAPTWGTCTGAGGDSTPDTIADDGAISGSEISDNTIEEVDLEITNAPTDNYVLSYDQATGGFTWVVDTGGTCPTCDNTADTIADDGVIALTTETSGDYVAGNTAGTGIAVTGTAGEGWSPTIGLDYAATLAANSLTANQSSFASTGLIFEGSTADGFETLLTLTNPTADNTITLPNASGTVAVSASGNIALSALGAITFTGTLPVGSGGTGATTLTSNGVLFGNGTGAIQATAAGTTGQCLIATTGSAPTWGTCTGAGGDSTPDTIADDGAISGSEISDNTIEEVDLEITNAPTDNYVLSYDQATGGFTWVVDTGGTCPTCDNTADTIADDGVIALTTETSGDYVAGNTAGTGIAVTGTAGEGWSPTIGLDYAATLAANSLTANQSSFASTGLIFEGSTADGFETLLTLTNPTADNTITLPNASGTVAVSASGNIALSALGAITFTGTLPVGSGGTGATTLTSNGVLFGNGTGAIQATAAGTTGQCLIATTGSAPTWGTCTGAGGDSTPDTIADDGAISGSEISDNTIEEVDLEITNAPTDNYVLSYDQATGGFTWVVDTGGTCPTCDNTADTIADDGVIALTTETSGDYVAGNTAGTGIAVTGTAGEGWSPTIGLDYAATLAANSLTANQSSFASTGLIFEGSTADGFETLLTLTNPTADNTITLPNASGTVAVSASGNIALSALGAITFTGTLPVGSGGTGATTLTSNGVLFGNGTGAIQATAAGTTGQCLIATTGSAPTWGTCTGAGGDSTPDTIADDGAISGSEISDNTIEEVDLEITNAPTDNYVLSYDQATGGFTWVVDTGGTCPTCDNTADTIADDGVIALTTETSGDYVAGNTAGTGIAVTGTAGEGWSPTIGLDYAATLAANSLTANQSSFASTGLIFEGSTADGFETLLTLTNPTADNTITLPNASGTVAVSASGNIALSALGAITFTGTLPVGSGGTGATTLTSNGVLFGNGTGAIQATAAGTTGQCLIATTGSAPTWGTCTGAGGDSTPDTIADDGAISGSEISDNTIEEVDLEITNAPTDNYVLSYDQATGGFTWVVDTGGTCPTCDNTADTIADDGVIALTTETSGDYVAGNTAGTGIAVTGTAGEGWSPTIGLDYAATLAANSLTANQSSFASTGLIFEGSTADGFETLLTLTNPTADNTITLPNASGTVAVSASGNIALSALGAITFTGTLPVGSGGTGATTLTSNGVLFGNGTGAIQATAAGTTGQCLIATTGSAPTWGTCTGAGGDSTPDTIADDGAISGSEISDNTIEEVDLEITNAPTDNYVLSYDQATGGFTWVVDADTDTNTTYSAGNDLDLTGTTFDIEPQLDSVTTISRASSNLTLQTTTSGNIILNSAGTIELQDNTNITGNANITGHISIGADAIINDTTLIGTSATYNNVVSVEERITSVGTDRVRGINNYLQLDPSSSPGASWFAAIDNQLETRSTNVQNFSLLEGAFNSVSHLGSGTVNTMNGSDNMVLKSAGAGTVIDAKGSYNYADGATNTYGLYSEAYKSPGNSPAVGITAGGWFVGSNTLSSSSGTDETYGLYSYVDRTGATGGTLNTYGMYIDIGTLDVAGAGTHNAYSLYLDSPTGADNNYALYSAGAANSYFAGNVGIGVATPSQLLSVNGVGMFGVENASEVLLGMSANTAGHEGVSLYHDGTEAFLSSVDAGTAWQDLSIQANAVRFDINGLTDNVIINSTGVGIGISPTTALDVNGGLRVQGTSANASGTTLFTSLIGTQTAASTGSFNGIQTSVSYTNAGTLAGLQSVNAFGTNSGSGTITSAYGVVSNITNASIGTISTAGGVASQIFNAAGGTINNAIGLFAQTPSNGGTIQSTYGLYVQSQTSGTQTNTPYGIYQAGASDTNYFAGSVGIGTVGAPSTKLDVNGTVTATGLALGTGTLTGAGLTDCDGANNKLLWDSTTSKFSCGVESGAIAVRKSVNEAISSATIQDDDELTFSMGPNETWTFLIEIAANFSDTPEFKFTVNSPGSSACTYDSMGITEPGVLSSVANQVNVNCGTVTTYTTSGSSDKQILIRGSVVNGASTSAVTFQWARNNASGTATVLAGSFLNAKRVGVGAGGGGGSTAWSALTAPTANLVLDHSTHNTTFDSGATTGRFFTMTGNSLSTGDLLGLTTSSTALTSGGLLTLSATGTPVASWTGSLGAIEYNNTSANVDGNALKVGLLGVGAGSGTALNITSAQTGTSSYVLRVNDDGGYNTDTTPFVIDTAGNVGVGTLTPSALLHVAGGVRITALNAASCDVKSDTNGDLFCGTDAGATATSLQSSYDAGNTITSAAYSGGRNISITLADTATDSVFEITQAGTANAFRVNDDGTFTDSTPFIIDQDGNVGIGTIASSTHKLFVTGTSALTSTSYIIGRFNGSQTTANSATMYGVYADPSYSASSGNTLTSLVGVRSTPTNSNTGTVTAIQAAYFEPNNSSSGTVGFMDSIWNNPQNSSTGTVDIMRGMYTRINNTGTINTAYGLYIADPVNTGTISTKYSLVTGPNTGFAGIGTFTPSTMLHVAGTITVNDHLLPDASPTKGSLTLTGTTVDSTGDVGQDTSIAIGSDGFPIISYYESISAGSCDTTSECNLKVIHCTNIACTTFDTPTRIDNATAGNQGGMDSSIIIGTDGLPIISFYDVTNADLKVAKCTNVACTTSTVSTVYSTNNVGSNTSIAIGSDGLPVIAFRDFTTGVNDLMVAKCNDIACAGNNETISTADSTGDSGHNASLKIGTDGMPIIAHYNDNADNMRISKCNDLACSGGDETNFVVSGGLEDGLNLDMEIGVDGLPVIAFTRDNGASGYMLRFLKCSNTSCTTAVTSTIIEDPGGTAWSGIFVSMVIGSDGLPFVAYHRADTTNDFKIAKCENELCTVTDIETIETTGDVGSYTSTVLGTDGLPTVAYRRADSGDLKVLKCVNADCDVSSGGGYSGGSSIGSIGTYFNNIYAAQFWGKSFQIAAFDLAEEYSVADSSIEAGDIVRIAGGTTVERTTNEYDLRTLGIVSSDPAITLGEWDQTGDNATKRPVALSGRVPVKIASDSAAIQPGDYLTTSATEPGKAKKADRSGQVIGKALGAWTPGSGVEKIIVFVTTSHANPIEEIQGSLGAGNFDSLNVLGEATIGNLTVENALTTKTLKVTEEATIGKLTVLTEIATQDLTVTGTATIKNLVVTHDATVAKITVQGHITVGKDTSGTIVIPAGQTEVIVTFENAYERVPKLTTSVDGFVLIKVVEKTVDGFKIQLQTAQPADTAIDWIALQPKDDPPTQP